MRLSHRRSSFSTQSKLRRQALKATPQCVAETLEARVLLSSYELSSVASFVSANGTYPQSQLVMDSSGDLFGTASQGGASGDGTVFEIAHGTTTITTLASFNGTNGLYPLAGVTLDASGDIFGTTEEGGAHSDGTVFEIAHGNTTITTVASFNGTNGEYPQGGVTLDASGDLFGTAENGGAHSDGTVFEIAYGNTTITTVASFNGTNGNEPYAGVTLDASGDLFGTTYQGGANSDGAVFEIVHGNTTITTLASFNGTNGQYPQAGVSLDASGDLFGTARAGGANSDGTVFEIVHGNTTITTLASFNGANGAYPYAGVTLDASGDLFGTTENGGPNGSYYGYGTAFEIVQSTTAIVTLANFAGGAGGAYPYAGMTFDASGDLFGTTYEGGSGYGTVFELSTYTNTVSPLNFAVNENSTYTFTAATFAAAFSNPFNNAMQSMKITSLPPHGQLTLNGTAVTLNQVIANSAIGGLVYTPTTGYLGQDSFGWSGSDGMSFAPSPSTVNLTVGIPTTIAVTASTGTAAYGQVVTFTATVTPASSSGETGNVTFQIDGGNASTVALSGNTASYATATLNPGGNHTIVAIYSGDANFTGNASPAFTVASPSVTYKLNSLASFNGTNGANPMSQLVMDSSGDLFGTTYAGGANSKGTVFEIVHGANAITTLASFNGTNGEYPQAGVTLDASGDLFGTTYDGGAYGSGYGDGTVFEIVNGTNTITTLASFNGTNGANPAAGVTFDASGDLFGATSSTVFEIVHGTTTINIVASAGSEGVTLDANGDIFGTTYAGGVNSEGSVFEIVHGTTTVSTLASFNGTNGGYPRAGVTLDASGDIFGTSSNRGGSTYNGSVFEIVHGTTTITTLASFNGTNGVYVYGGVTLDASGDIFGTTYENGVYGNYGNGNVFEIVRGTNAITTLASFNGTNGQYPEAGVIFDANGNLYGTTDQGGASNEGTVFELSPDTSTVSPLNLAVIANSSYTFTASSFAGAFNNSFNNSMQSIQITSLPAHGQLTLSGTAVTLNQVIATSALGGLVYTPTTGYAGPDSFGWNGSDGSVYAASSANVNFTVEIPTTIAVTSSSGTAAYGQVVTFTATVTPASGSGETGNVTFQIDGGSVSTVALSGNTASYTTATLTAGENHAIVAIYSGNTNFAGSTSSAFILTIPAAPYNVNFFASFNGTNGASPDSKLVMDSSGDIFGTTPGGGAYGDGTVFEIVHGTMAITTVASFNGTNGSAPTGVTLDAGGNLFGTAAGGASGFWGEVFEIVHGTNTITIVASLTSTNGYDTTGVTLDASGDLFGTTLEGGAQGDGTVFEVVHGASTVTALTYFTGMGINSEQSWGGLAIDANGDLFGATWPSDLGWAGLDGNSYGTVYEIAHGTTTITTVATFNSAANGSRDYGGVTLDANGDIFGTTAYGGANGDGNVFEVVHGTNTITTLANFNGTNGAVSEAGVTLDANGDIFGTTCQGGGGSEYGNGTVFEVVQGSNTITTLTNFNGNYGQEPTGGVTVDARGDVFGTAYDGGAYSDGTFFELSPDPSILTPLNLAVNKNGSYTFATSTFAAAFSNAFNNSLLDVEITSLPTHGQLTLNGTAVSLNQVIAAGALGELVYTPASGYAGPDSFGWNGSDGTAYAAYPSTVNLTVAVATTIAVTSSNASPNYGQSVTFTATVTPSTGSGETGTVQFQVDGGNVGTPVTLSGNTATYTTSTLSGGSDSIVAVYSGDSNFATSTSPTLTQTVIALGTTTVVTSSGGSTIYGQSVTFTATVTPASGSNESGNVTFQIDGGNVSGPVTLSGNTATYATSMLSAGNHTVDALYSGDGNFSGSTSSSIRQTVTKAATASTVTSSNSSPSYGQSVTFTATVNPASGSGETGTVRFQIDGGNVGSPIAVSGNTASYTTSSLSVGSDSIVAVYSGDGNFTGSTSSPITVTVTMPLVTAFSNLSASSSVNFGTASVTFAGTIAAGSSIPPSSEDVAITLNGVTQDAAIGTNGNFTTTFDTSTLPASTTPYQVTYAYAGDTTFTSDTDDTTTTLTVTTFVAPPMTFQAVNEIWVGWYGMNSVAVGDFSGNGNADLAVAAGGDVLVMMGNGNGTFQGASSEYSGGNPVAVAVGNFTGNGIEDLAVANSNGTVGVLQGYGNGYFWLANTYTVGNDPSSVAVGDFTGNGIMDIAVTNASDGTVSVLLGNGDGTFQPAVSYAVGNDPNSVAMGDFTGDGVMDLAVANENSNTVSILLGNGDGTFQPAVAYAAGSSPESVAVGDFAGDGKVDLAVADNGGGVSVLMGNGDGTFQLAAWYAAGSGPDSVAVGDFNADGNLDLAVVNYWDSDVSVLLGNGDGTFQTPVNLSTGYSDPESVAVGDFNGDGRPDLAVADFNGGLSVLMNTTGMAIPAFSNLTASSTIAWGTTSVTFGGTIAASTSIPPSSESVAITLNGVTENAAIASNGNFSATFNPSAMDMLGSTTPYQVTYAYAGDNTFTSATDNTTTTLTVNGSIPLPTFQTATNFSAGNQPQAVASGDFNGDGKLDLAVIDYGSWNGSAYVGSGVSVLLGNGNGTYQAPVWYAAGVTPESVTVGNFNGHADLVVADQGTWNGSIYAGGVSVLLGNGNGTFQPAVNYAAGDLPMSVAVGDFLGNGKEDLAVANYYGNNVSILLGNGDGTFQAPVNYATGYDPHSIAVGDFNGDGKLDLAVADTGGGVSVLLGNGNGSFQAPVNYAVGSWPWAIAAGDLNGDGKTDLVVADEGGGVSVLLGNGNGTFQTAVNYTVAGYPESIAVGDFNGDGKLDVAVASYPNVTVLVGYGDGRLQEEANYAAGDPIALAVGDFNGDGQPDLAATNGYGGVDVLLNSTATTPTWVAAGGGATWNASNQTLTVTGSTTLTGNPAGANIVLSGPSGQLVINGGGTTVTIGTISGGGTVTVNSGSSLVAGSISQAASLVNNGTAVIGGTVIPPSTLVANTTITDTIGVISGNGSLTIDSGIVLVAGNVSQAALVNNGSVSIDGSGAIGQLTGNGSLTIGNGTSDNTVQLTAAGTPDSVTNTQKAVTISVGSTLDITNNILLINYGSGSTPLAAVQVAVAYGAGVNGASGASGAIISSTANAGNLGQCTIGFADSTELSSIASGNVKVIYTLTGDANLDGRVNFNDFSLLQNNYDQSGRDWSQGDYNHDGLVNFNDFSLLQNNYDQSLTGASSIFSSAAINSAAPKAAAAPVASSDAAPVYATYTPATENLFSSGADSILA